MHRPILHFDIAVFRRLAMIAHATLLLAAIETCPKSARAENLAPDLDRHPNIVFILADDLGINDLGCYGRTDQHTPALDRLASEGLRFTSAYAAQSVCSPSRAAILSGKAPGRLHLTTFLAGRPDATSQMLLHPKIEQHLPLEEQTLAERLKPLGYASICIGKWHLGGKGFLPTDQGFDAYYAGRENTVPSDTEGSKGEYDLTAHAEKFIEEHRDQPFFLYLAHNSPHIPFAAKPEQIAKNADAFNPTYAAVIESLDDCVGRVAAQIDRLGLGERTIFIFTSDNGGLHVRENPLSPATHNTPWRAGKGFCYEGGLRVPLIVRWTKHTPRNKLIEAPVIGTDWTPTLVELAGGAPVNDSDGLSLAAVIAQGKTPPARMFYWHMPHYMNQGSRPSGAVRDGRWKLIENYEDGACELFDLDADASETRDISADYPGEVARLRGALEKWRRDLKVRSNTENPDFDPAAWKPLYRDVDVSILPLEKSFSIMAEKLGAWRQGMNQAIEAKPNPGPGHPTGAVALEARDAQTHGEKLRYEDAPHKDTLGFWTVKDDWVEWKFQVPRAGTYEVELLQGCGKGSGGAEIEIAIDGERLTTQVVETGHFQRFIPRDVGKLKINSDGQHTLTIHAISKPGGAVMDLRRVRLIATAP